MNASSNGSSLAALAEMSWSLRHYVVDITALVCIIIYGFSGQVAAEIGRFVKFYIK